MFPESNGSANYCPRARAHAYRNACAEAANEYEAAAVSNGTENGFLVRTASNYTELETAKKEMIQRKKDDDHCTLKLFISNEQNRQAEKILKMRAIDMARVYGFYIILLEQEPL
ncbi:hypothetical protein TSUD_346970 [Trifolium subterraneum]|nr:hypothetical protein TSUD_346970 [Trifolium subterraneum]